MAVANILLNAALGMVVMMGDVADAAAPATGPAGNAATFYWAAFNGLPNDPAFWGVLRNWNDTPLDATAQRAIDAGRKSLDQLALGAKLRMCDWQLDYRKGPELLLPQLNKGRVLAQLACLRARWEFQKDEPLQAVDDLVNTITLARHLSNDRMLIGLLVRDNIEQMAIPILAAHLLELDKTALEHLTERLSHLPAGGSLMDGINTEEDSSMAWVLERAREAAAIGEPVDWGSLGKWLGESGNAEWNAVKDDPPENILSEAQALMPYFDQVEKLIRSSENQRQTDQALESVARQYGKMPLAAILLPSYRRAFDTDAGARTLTTLLDAGVAIARGGKEWLRDFRDPVNHRPIEYRWMSKGFELESTVSMRGRMVRSLIGAAAK